MFNVILASIERRIIGFLLAVFIFRTGFLLVSGLDLIGDESYYWDWSRRPDWCYFSKPPMVAWLIAASTAVFGDNVVGVRLPAVLLGNLTLFYVYKTACEIYSPRAGALALLITLAMPLNALNNFLMTIDALLNCFWVMTLYYLRKALFEESLKAWFWAGVATGAALLSKQVAVLLPLMLAIFLLTDPYRRLLFKRAFPLYLVPVVISLMPILWWNQQHDWIMFGHSRDHFDNRQALTLPSRLQNGATFFFYQLLLVSPVLFGFMLSVSIDKLRFYNKTSAEEHGLLLMGPVLLLGIFALSVLQKVQGNWAAPFYLSTVVLLSGQSFKGVRQAWLNSGLALGCAMVALTYLLPVAVRALNVQDTRFDPTARFRHWPEIAEAVDRVRQHIGNGREDIVLITLGHRYLTSQLAFYLSDRPRVFRYETGGGLRSQYEIWGGPTDRTVAKALIVTADPSASVPPELSAAFESVRPVGAFADPLNAKGRYRLYLGVHLTDWPRSEERNGTIP